VILASGPSLTQEQVDLCLNQAILAINDSYLLAPWAQYHYHCDLKWYNWHKDNPEYKSFNGIKITQDTLPDKSILRIKGKHEKGVSFNSEYIHYGSNSGIQALNIAVHMGASRIILLGYDMKIAGNGLAHWFGDHPDKVRSNYAAWLTNYGIAADQLRDKGIEVINCSPDTALICFPRMTLESALSLAPGQVLRESKSIPLTAQG
jgi:hypothetical protein